VGRKQPTIFLAVYMLTYKLEAVLHTFLKSPPLTLNLYTG